MINEGGSSKATSQRPTRAGYDAKQADLPKRSRAAGYCWTVDPQVALPITWTVYGEGTLQRAASG